MLVIAHLIIRRPYLLDMRGTLVLLADEDRRSWHLIRSYYFKKLVMVWEGE